MNNPVLSLAWLTFLQNPFSGKITTIKTIKLFKQNFVKVLTANTCLKIVQTSFAADYRQRLPTDLETIFKLSFLVLYSKKQVFKNKTG